MKTCRVTRKAGAASRSNNVSVVMTAKGGPLAALFVVVYRRRRLRPVVNDVQESFHRCLKLAVQAGPLERGGEAVADAVQELVTGGFDDGHGLPVSREHSIE